MTSRIKGYVRDPATGVGQNNVTVTLKKTIDDSTVTSDASSAAGLYEMTVANVGYPGPVYETFTVSGETKTRSGEVWGQLGGMIWPDTLTDLFTAFGIGVIGGTGLAVTASGANMNVSISAGTAILKDGVPYVLESAASLTIGTSDPTNPRIDRIVLQLVREGQATQGRIDLEVLAGTPAGSPSAPSLTQSASTWELSLAQVSVLAGVTTIAADKVTDERTYAFSWPTVGADDLLYINSSGILAAMTDGRLQEWAFQFGDGSNVITASSHTSRVEFRVPYACTVTGWFLWSPTATASLVIDVNKASSPSAAMSSVAGSEKPTLSAAAAYAVASDSSLTTWTDTTWTKGEYIQFEVDSVTNTTRAYLSLLVTRT
jgi:hypothetical protein